MKCYYNGQMIDIEQFNVTSKSRAFCYGDGVFETIITDAAGFPRHWAAHWQRLTAGLMALQIAVDEYFTSDFLLKKIQELAQINAPNVAARVRLQVWRKTGGLYTPTQNGADWLLEAQPHEAFVGEKQTTILAQSVHLQASAWSAYKTCNSLPYILAGLERVRYAADEIILTDTAGHLAECQAANLFWVKNNTLFTPSLQTGCIAGITRSWLLRNAARLGWQVQEICAKPDVLQETEIVFGGNVAGVFPIRRLHDWHFRGNTPAVIELLTQFYE
ncbi:branched-chain amino acid aminotransferase/4-amino-4-deoxychorismate lyase [Flexibacter flexilis DSM 6793]|uniref:Branched-chain amino acid aminotransferase/4-amino-4-deoxychorismate lyase n=1 Tax=Flexibacter flexilis DSM 6793 TaxID=927664 RepID=A0A1I1LFK6_9BACT|nr:aminotransferase class IV [Flexibacter flexilis]SFC69798.1 branched-chain amino acid aminotransferase/4-amino-4-deoxychorismate lyase [Flexibacter flexilis DSM 6793]